MCLPHRGPTLASSPPRNQSWFHGTLPLHTPLRDRLPRVLIAEDDDDTRQALVDLVADLGVEIAEASSGGDLVMLLTDDRPSDLLITDVRMPWTTGLQVALSARNSGMDLPIIVMTAYPDDEIRTQISQLDSTVLLTKPFQPDELICLVRERLAQRGFGTPGPRQ
jgi:CheY-like chemotaxis protein